MKRGIKTADTQTLQFGKDFADDVLSARTLLTAKGWLFEEYQVTNVNRELHWGLVFAHPTRLLILQRRGWFTQFDSTRKLNRWNHNLFSFLVRDEHNVWVPTAHLVAGREDGELIASALKRIERWCAGEIQVLDDCYFFVQLTISTAGKWQPRYIMTDDTSLEQRAVRIAFPAGERRVDHLLCSVHSSRTLLRRLSSTAHKPAYNLLKHAMYCFTGIQNRQLCEQAIAAAPDEETKEYIGTIWLQTAPKWAMYARQHNPMLLQVTATSPCEAWHRKLKARAGLSKGQVSSHGIFGMILNTMDAAHDVDIRAAIAKSNFRSEKLAICTKQYPEIGRFPVPIQKLLAVELERVEERFAKGKGVPTFEDDAMRCCCKYVVYQFLH